jgi:SAM-dependent methyltransferase
MHRLRENQASLEGSAIAQQWRTFARMLKEDGYGELDRYFYSAGRTFRHIDFARTRVLEIGSGRGLRTVFMALLGAELVVSMEPELAGSRRGVVALQETRIRDLGLSNVKLLKQDFNVWQPASQEFDVLVSESSINHLFESPYHALRHTPTYQIYLGICQKMHAALRKGGVAVITDASRYSFFALAKRAGIKPPWKSKAVSANWRIHQNAGVWKRILEDAGFSSVSIAYFVPFKLRRIERLVDNRMGNFLLSGKFLIAAQA